MKKLVFTLVVIAILLVACGPSDADCDSAWDQMDVKFGEEGMIIRMALNENFAPGTVGKQLQECINSGWDGYR